MPLGKTNTSFLEMTMTGMIPVAPVPLAGLGPFPEEEKARLISRLQVIFPGHTEAEIKRVVFGNNPRRID